MMFLVIVLATLALIHGYVGLRIIPTLGLQGSWLVLVWIGLALITFLPIAPILLRFRGYENSFTDNLSWVGYTSLGFFTLTFLVVLTRDLSWVIWNGVTKLASLIRPLLEIPETFGKAHSPDRRQFIITAMNLGILSLTGGLSAWGLFQARRDPIVMEIDIPINNLPHQLIGLRIVQLSDLHVGPTIKRDFVQRVVDQVKELKPDLIVLTGDLIDGSVSHLNNDVAPLSELKAPYGKFFITGNHEYYSGVEHWLKETDRLGFINLVNDNRVLDVRGAKLTVAGVTDLSAARVEPSHATDPKAALDGAPADSVKLLLAHQPGSVYEAQKLGVDLQLSGHTHGGQFKPFHLAVSRAYPYIAGLYNHNGTWVYVNRGTGYWGPPLRLGISSEITVVRLISS